MALENQWLQSQKANNADLVAPLIADKCVYTGPDGKVSDKAGFKGKGTDPSGKPNDEHTCWTDVWVKMPNGKWQCVASQDPRIKM